MESAAIETEGLTRDYGKVRAVDNVNIKIKAGEIYALIGPNGAGKTTLIKMLVGLLRPTRGVAKICGFDINKESMGAKRSFGYVPDNPLVYDYLTGYEFLNMTGALRGVKEQEIKKRVSELTDIFPLKDILFQKMGTYSRGNRQKTAFLASIISKPEVLLIDEPISGLDPTSITAFGETLKKYVKDGGAVFLATHILSFGQKYADRVGAMDNGKIKKETPVNAEHNLEKIYKEATNSK
jgi:ABC-2 type transport system ATP-binding protein